VAAICLLRALSAVWPQAEACVGSIGRGAVMVEMEKLDKLQKTLNYQFKDNRLLIRAVTHKTFAYESQKEDIRDNQKLEFLGDSILGMVTAEYLYRNNSASGEGELTRRRSLLVNNVRLFEKAREMDLSQYLLVGKGEEKIGGRHNSKNLSCALEALIGAIYLDGGFEAAKKFIIEKIV